MLLSNNNFIKFVNIVFYISIYEAVHMVGICPISDVFPLPNLWILCSTMYTKVNNKMPSSKKVYHDVNLVCFPKHNFQEIAKRWNTRVASEFILLPHHTNMGYLPKGKRQKH